MPTTTQLHILDSGAIKLIQYGDQLNRQLGGFLRTLSRFVLGVVIAVLLIPVTILILIVTTAIARVAFEYISYVLKMSLKTMHKTDDRELMESLLDIEEMNSLLNKTQKDLNSTKLRKAYFTVFFGDSWRRCMNRGEKLQKEIESKVYPHLHDELSEDQIRRLLKEYEGMPTD